MSQFASLAEEIAKHSESPLFGVPGSGATLSLLNELEKRGREFITAHFEGSAAMMAATVGRLSGKAGVCLSIKGPGLTNMVPGLAVANFESFPLVAIAEAYPPGSSPSQAHKRIDQTQLVSPITKGLTQLSKSGPKFCEIAAFAESEVPGPVVLELASPDPDRSAPLPNGLAVPRKIDASRLTDLVTDAKRPIVIAGMLALRQGLSDLLNELKIPVFSTAAAKGVVDEMHSYSAGVYTGVGLGLSPEHSLLKETDLIVCIGVRPHEVLATKPFPARAVNIAAAVEPGDDAFAFEAVAESSAAKDVLAALSANTWGSDTVAEAHDRLRSASLSNHFLPAHVFRLTQAHFGRDARGVFDTGYFCTMAEHLWLADDASKCLMSGQGRYMGTGIPMALGAAVHDRSMPTIVFVGDGGVGPFVGEARIAVEKRLPILFCLLTDGYFSSIRTRALREGLTQKPMHVAQRSWRRVFEGFGMPALAADDEVSFTEALGSWRPVDGPAFIEVSFEPEPYQAMVKQIR